MMTQSASTEAPFGHREAEVYVWKGAGVPGAWGHPLYPSYLQKKSTTGSSIYSPLPASAEPLTDPLRIEMRMWEEAGTQALSTIEDFLDALGEEEDGSTA